MGVYFKGMSMPSNCKSCDVGCFDVKKYAIKCPITGTRIDYEYAKTKRAPNCPAISVQPHGRLIDKDALLKDIDEGMIITPKNGEYIEVFGEEKLLTHIAYAPTIIPETEE